MLFVLHLCLIDLFTVLLVLLVGLLFEVPPLVKHFVELLLETVALHFLLLLEVEGVGVLDLQLSDFIISGVDDRLVLLPQRFNESTMPLTSLLRLFLQGLFESFDLPEILSLLQLDPISLQICFFDALLALSGEVLN